MSNPFLALPRPGTALGADRRIIAAPSEASFTETFGKLLPTASYLQTEYGKAAYYSIPPSNVSTPKKKASISRVLFVHGVQTSAIGLQPLARDLSSRFPEAHCILFDHWGHGLSDAPVIPYEPALFHFLIGSLMNHLGWEDAHFIGYSFGSATTVTFAAIKPQRVSSMVLVAPAGLLRTEQFTELQQIYIRGGERSDEDDFKGILDILEGGELVVPLDWKQRVANGELVASAVRDWQLKNHEGHAASIVAVFRDGGALDRHDDFRKVANLRIPSLAILGELDQICNEQDLRNVGMDRSVVIPKVGHEVVRERVPEVAQYIEAFWNDLV